MRLIGSQRVPHFPICWERRHVMSREDDDDFRDTGKHNFCSVLLHPMLPNTNRINEIKVFVFHHYVLRYAIILNIIQEASEVVQVIIYSFLGSLSQSDISIAPMQYHILLIKALVRVHFSCHALNF